MTGKRRSRRLQGGDVIDHLLESRLVLVFLHAFFFSFFFLAKKVDGGYATYLFIVCLFVCFCVCVCTMIIISSLFYVCVCVCVFLLLSTHTQTKREREGKR